MGESSSTVKMLKRTFYVYSKELIEVSCKIPNIENRAAITHELLNAYGLLKAMGIVNVEPASYAELCAFHSPLYVDYLKNASGTNEEESETNGENPDIYGIGYDCPFMSDMYKFATLIAGGSLSGVRTLISGQADIVLNWYGGWHHAQRDEAEGFCYVNDIVIAIEELRKKFSKILYIDLDIHHGNGVENAYSNTKRVFTFSMHKYESGFYPGTGDLRDIGYGSGKYHCVNVPLKDGISDKPYCILFKKILDGIAEKYEPECVVVQCGTDALTGDRLGGFNLTQMSYGYCVKQILHLNKPTIFLGGGGYNKCNAARCWAYITSIIINYTISDDIPDINNQYFEEFGPDFTLNISRGTRQDSNNEEDLQQIFQTISGNLSKIQD